MEGAGSSSGRKRNKASLLLPQGTWHGGTRPQLAWQQLPWKPAICSIHLPFLGARLVRDDSIPPPPAPATRRPGGTSLQVP